MGWPEEAFAVAGLLVEKDEVGVPVVLAQGLLVDIPDAGVCRVGAPRVDREEFDCTR